MVKVKIILTVLTVLAVAAFGYQYLPAGRTAEEQANTFTFTAGWEPNSTADVVTEIYIYAPGTPAASYVYRDRKSPRVTVKVVSPGSKILFSSHYPGEPKGSFWCQLERDGYRVAYDNIPNDGLVTCDYKVPL